LGTLTLENAFPQCSFSEQIPGHQKASPRGAKNNFQAPPWPCKKDDVLHSDAIPASFSGYEPCLNR
jgi:hypothetical protein